MAGTIIQQEFFGSPEQEGIAEAMGWSEFEVTGRMAYLWNGSQRRKLSIVSAKQIGTWCKLSDVEQRTKFIEVLCSEAVGLLKRRRLDAFEIVGNKKHVKKLKQISALRSAGGKTTRAKFPKQNPEKDQKQDAEVKLDPILTHSPLTHSIPSHSPLTHAPAPPEHDPNQESFALGGKSGGRSDEGHTLQEAIARAEARGDAPVAKQLRALFAKLNGLSLGLEGVATA